MKSVAVLVMLALLLIQATWSVVAPYCQHESGKQARHFGHHVHQHAPSAGDQHDSNGKLTVDQDCPACHSSLPTLLSAQWPAQVLDMLIIHARREPIGFRSRPPDTPFRPCWRLYF